MNKGKNVFPNTHMKKNHKMVTQVHKIQILINYLKIISILCTFFFNQM